MFLNIELLIREIRNVLNHFYWQIRPLRHHASQRSDESKKRRRKEETDTTRHPTLHPSRYEEASSISFLILDYRQQTAQQIVVHWRQKLEGQQGKSRN